ncbi:MAG: flagellar filament capping protein FliD [Pseudohongiellaceae bacterium]
MAITTNNNNEIGGKITQALGAGSGVDIHNLATTLAETETMPRINKVTEKKAESTVAISGYGVLKSSVSSLKTSFEALKNKDTLLTKTIKTNHEDRIDAVITSQGDAPSGIYQIRVTQLARPQANELKDNGSSFTALNQSLSGSNFTITIKVPRTAGSGTDVVVTDHTPQGIIDAVNSISSTTGVTARAFNPASSGTTFSILLEGSEGSDKTFEFSSTLTGGDAITGGTWNDKTRDAQDLIVEMNGRADVRRQTNSPTDLIPGVQTTFMRYGPTTDINLVISEDTSALDAKLNSMVEAYNQFITLSDYLTGEKDEDDELAGSLGAEKGTVNLIKSRIRGIIGQTSESASNGVSTLRDLGIQTKLGGQISLNATTYATVVRDKFSDVRTMLTADLIDQDKSDTRDHGLALDITTVLDNITNDQGTITTKETNVTADVARYEEELIDLQERLETIKQRYLRQFVAMESLVQRNKSTGEYLTGQFKAMENMYSSK